MRASAPVWRIPKPGLMVERGRAWFRPPAMTPALVATILEPLDLGRVERVRNVANGWRNRIVVVEVGGERVVVRGYPSRWPTESVRCEHSILEVLAGRGFPAPRVLRGGDDSTLIEVEGERYAVLSFEDGRSFTGYYLHPGTIRRLQEEAGALLAGFHRSLGSFRPPTRHHLGLDPVTDEPVRTLRWYLDVLDRVRKIESPNESDLLARVDELGERLIVLEPVIMDAPLPRTVVHGDFGLHNILFRQHGPALLHDFELARYDIRLVDVVAALSRIRSQFRPSFLTGLRSGGGIDETEWELLPRVWEWYRLTGAIQSWEVFARHGGNHRLEAAHRRLVEADRVRRHGVDVG